MELGSNYEFDSDNIRRVQYNVKEYLKDEKAVYTDSGRSAIRLLLPQLKKRKILMPAYICKSVIDCFHDDFVIEFYQLDDKLQINLEDLKLKLNQDVSVVYVMHYFGMLQGKEQLTYIMEQKKEYGYVIIEDTTHCLLTVKKTIGDFQVCSLRKWFPIPDGGVLYGNHLKDHYQLKEEKDDAGKVTEAMILKNLYIKEGIDCNNAYRKIFMNAERKLDDQKEIYHLSTFSEVLLECINTKQICERRKNNWNYLYGKLAGTGIVPMFHIEAEYFIPFAFPVLVENRDDFRAYLIKNQVYCAIHWEMETEQQKGIKENIRLSEHILSLPIDQRYTKEHMEYLVETIQNYNAR